MKRFFFIAIFEKNNLKVLTTLWRVNSGCSKPEIRACKSQTQSLTIRGVTNEKQGNCVGAGSRDPSRGTRVLLSSTREQPNEHSRAKRRVTGEGNGLPAGAKRVFSFNLIGYPAGQTYTGDCGEGHRIFVNRDANHAHIVVVGGNTGWSVVDCNATDNNTASLQTDTTGTFEVFVRILGKPGGSVTVCADTLSDCILFGTCDAFCHLGTFTLNRVGGKSSFTIEPSSMFDASLFNIIWTVTTNSDYRIAQFVVVQLS